MGNLSCVSACAAWAWVSNSEEAVVGCVSIRLRFSTCCFVYGMTNDEFIVLGTPMAFKLVSCEEEVDSGEGTRVFSAMAGVFAFVAVSKACVVKFSGMLALSAGMADSGIEVVRRAGKLLEAPFDDFVAFPLGTDVGVDLLIAPCGEVTIRAPHLGQKCAAVSNKVVQLLQNNVIVVLLCISWGDLVVSVTFTHFLSTRTFS